MRVLLCGAAGFTGRAILRELLDAGHEVRAWDLRPESWVGGIDDPALETNPSVEKVFGTIADFDLCKQYIEGCAAIVHTTVLFTGGDQPDVPGEYTGEDVERNELSWIVNLKGLWNILECARLTEGAVQRVVHVGSCQHEWPATSIPGKEEARSVFFDEDVRRPDCGLYPVHKRLQEEMCRQFYEGHGLRIIVLRPSGIMDVELGISRSRQPISKTWSTNSVCRRHLGQAAVGAIRATGPESDFCVLHAVTLPEPALVDEADDPRHWCNVGKAASVLDGFDFTQDVRPHGYVAAPPAKL